MNEIAEADLPGIGKRFTITTAAGETVTVISHLTGRRDIYHSTDDDKEPGMLSLTDEEARQLSAVLGDTFFKPTPMDMLRSALASRARMELVRVPPGSRSAGVSLKELDIRGRTGVSVLAIQRGEETAANPKASTVLAGGDILIAMGTPEELGKLAKLLQSG